MELKENSQEKTYKCSSCGAALKEDEKNCDYCGSINPNFKDKSKDVSKQSYGTKGGLADIFGGMFANIPLSNPLKDFIDNND